MSVKSTDRAATRTYLFRQLEKSGKPRGLNMPAKKPSDLTDSDISYILPERERNRLLDARNAALSTLALIEDVLGFPRSRPNRAARRRDNSPKGYGCG